MIETSIFALFNSSAASAAFTEIDIVLFTFTSFSLCRAVQA